MSDAEPQSARWRLGDRNYRLLSQLTGVSQDYLSRVLRGRSKPSLDIALKIADAAGVEPRVLHEYLQERQAGVRERAAELTPQIGKGNGTRISKPGGFSKLTAADAAIIRIRYADREQFPITIRELAADYDVSPQAISDIVRGVTYKELAEIYDRESA